MTNFGKGFGFEAIPARTTRSVNVLAPPEQGDEIFHIQADGFWGPEKGFHDAEQIRNERQSAN
jgi:hypothetical protein